MRAFIFPGQGSQSVGMGVALAEASREARAVFDEVDEALGQHLFKLMAEGPVETLTLTENAQPAIMDNAIATCARGPQPRDSVDLAAGHSLGEYSALCAAGAFDLATARCSRRGRAMQEEGPVRGGNGCLLGADWRRAAVVDAAAKARYARSPTTTIRAGGDLGPSRCHRARAHTQEKAPRRILLRFSPFHFPMAAGRGCDGSGVADALREPPSGLCNFSAARRGSRQISGCL